MFLLPLVGAILWGLWYVFADEGLRSVSVATWMCFSGLGALFFALCIHFSGDEPINFKPMLESNRVFMIVVGCVVIAKLADLTIAYSLKELPTTYVAILEVCYPLFVPIFAYLILQQNQLSTSTVVGGMLVLAGVLVIVLFQGHEHEKTEKLAQNDQRIVVVMPPYDADAPEILWNQWASLFPEKSGTIQENGLDLILVYNHYAKA